MTRDIRARALQKIAALSASSSNASFDRSDLDRLCRACHAGTKNREYTNGGANAKHVGSLGRVPMVNTSQGPSIAIANSLSQFENSKS